nr:MAG TPA: hypothetical protein [Caudoviricetes sp.]
MKDTDKATEQELKHFAELIRKDKEKSKYDKAILDALEMFNKALKSAKKPKIRKRYPIYPVKEQRANGWQCRERKAWKICNK